MAVARVAKVLLGTDETAGVTIANNATTNGAEVDVLGGDAALGYAHVYLKFTSTVTTGTIDLSLVARRISGQDYPDGALKVFTGVAPTIGTKSLFMGTVTVSRFMRASVKNNGTGADATNVFVALEVFQVT